MNKISCVTTSGGDKGRWVKRCAGHAAIGGFKPALTAADHAAGDDVGDAAVLEPATDKPQEGGFEPVAVQSAHPVVGRRMGDDPPA